MLVSSDPPNDPCEGRATRVTLGRFHRISATNVNAISANATHTRHTDVNPIFAVDWIFKNITLRSGFEEVFLE